jgi:hypothetical protein
MRSGRSNGARFSRIPIESFPISIPVIKSSASSKWINYFKPVDEIWRVSTGGHFFHHIHSELVSYHVQNFWQKLEPAIAFHQPMKVEFN